MDITDEIKLAIVKQNELPARKTELGGDYYYKCYWKDCNADVNSFQNYCWKCGQKLIYE